MSVRRRAIKARVERERERKRRFDETTASLNELLRRVEADPEGVRAQALAAFAPTERTAPQIGANHAARHK